MRRLYDIDAVIARLEMALHNARDNAICEADVGHTEDSIHADGVVEGLQWALEIVRNPKGHPNI